MSLIDNFPDSNPFIVEGFVKDVDDPDQMGRVKVWCPAVDGENFDVEQLPWAEYASPLAGVTLDYPAGRNKAQTFGFQSYGLWAIPKVGAQVLVFFLNGDANRRFYFASFFGLHRNRSLPAGRNKNVSGQVGPWSDTYDSTVPSKVNLTSQFQGNLTNSISQTRGVYERQVAQEKTDKDGTEGYQQTPVAGQNYLDPQTYCLVTPGHHAIIMQDHPTISRLRIKTAEGNQVIFDDANERIYVSTASGRSWIEMDEDGHINIFGASSISIRSGEDINLRADRDINLEAQRTVNLKAVTGAFNATTHTAINLYTDGTIFETACQDHQISTANRYTVKSERTIDITSTLDLDLRSNQANLKGFAQNAVHWYGAQQFHVTTGGRYNRQSASTHVNPQPGSPSPIPATPAEGAEADCATKAEGPTVVPGFEPWPRPAAATPRNPNWKE